MGTLGENPIRFMKLDVISEINNLKFCKLLELLRSKSAVEIIFNQTKYRITYYEKHKINKNVFRFQRSI